MSGGGAAGQPGQTGGFGMGQTTQPGGFGMNTQQPAGGGFGMPTPPNMGSMLSPENTTYAKNIMPAGGGFGMPIQAPNGNFGVPGGMGGGLPAQGGMRPSGGGFPSPDRITPGGILPIQPQIIPGTGGPGAVNPNLTPSVQQASPFQGPNTSALKSQMNDFMASSPIFQQINQLRNQVMQSGGIPTPQQEQQMRDLSQQFNNDPQMMQFSNQLQALNPQVKPGLSSTMQPVPQVLPRPPVSPPNPQIQQLMGGINAGVPGVASTQGGIGSLGPMRSTPMPAAPRVPDRVRSLQEAARDPRAAFENRYKRYR